MTLRFLLGVALVAVCLVAGASPAAADCSIEYVEVESEGAIVLHAVQVCTGDAATPVGAGGSPSEPPRDSELDAICVAQSLELDEDPFKFCDIPPEAAEDLLTPDVVASAFRRIPLPGQTVRIQPANGRTLVNFETNFFTDAAPFDRTVTLLGQQVDLRITPAEFTWRFGDGTAESGTDAGAPYPDLRVTHDYAREGRVAPSMDTTYSAIYRVNGGAWRDVPGTVTIAGPTVPLQVLTARPTLVGSD